MHTSKYGVTWMAIVVTLSGCTGMRLPSENAVDELAALKSAAATTPERTTRVPIGRHAGRTVHLAVHETGGGRAPRVVVMLHGVLADSRSWRFLRPGLVGEF